MKSKILEKYCYISYPIITIILLFIVILILKYFNINVNLASNFSETIVQISGSLIGFLLTAITVFLSFPKDTRVMLRFKKYKHHIIFSRCIFCGIFALITSIFCWIFQSPKILVLIFFILGLENTIISARYIYKLVIYNFE